MSVGFGTVSGELGRHPRHLSCVVYAVVNKLFCSAGAQLCLMLVNTQPAPSPTDNMLI